MGLCVYIRAYYPLGALLVGALLAAALGGIPAVLIFVEGRLIDGALLGMGGDPQGRFVPYLMLYAALLLCSTVLAALLKRNTERHKLVTGRRLDTARLEKANRVAFSVTETQSFHALFERAGKAPELDDACYRALQEVTTGIVQILTCLSALLVIDPWTVFGLAVLLCAGILLNFRLVRRTDGFWGRYIENMRRANYLASLLMRREYAAERKLFGYQPEIEGRFQREFARAEGENDRLGQGRFRIELVITLFSVLYSAAAILLLLRPLLSGTITIGAFTAAVYAAGRLRKRSTLVCDGLFSFFSSRRQLSGFFSFLALEEKPAPVPSVSDLDGEAGIQFRHVSFTYPGCDRPVLQDVSFTLRPGVHYALVGENGCGKTTLVKLLVGLYQPTAGDILVGGRPLGGMTDGEKRQVFSVVFQDFYRYPLSVRENVSLSAGEALDDQTVSAVFDRLDFHPSLLRQRDGLDSSLMQLKETGAGLSGGEWQKLAIARCVLSTAPVAVLDEPNAALDPIAEGTVYRAYRELLARKTTLFISHRLGSVRMSDQILVLRQGRLLAMDSHEGLMGGCPYYAELFETQRRLYDEG